MKVGDNLREYPIISYEGRVYIVWDMSVEESEHSFGTLHSFTMTTNIGSLWYTECVAFAIDDYENGSLRLARDMRRSVCDALLRHMVEERIV